MTYFVHDSPTFSGRRQSEPASLWVALLAGSVMVHLFLFLGLRQWVMRPVKISLASAPISVEFVQPTRSTSAPGVTANPLTQAPVRRSAPATAPAASSQTQTNDRAVAIAPDLPSTIRETIPQPRPRLPAQERVRRETVPPRETTPRETVPPDAGNNPAREPSPQTPPDLPTTEVSRNPQDGRNDRPSSEQPVSDVAESGRALPSVQGEAAVVELLSQRQVQDIKQQPAQPRESNRQMAVYYPVKPTQPIEIEAHLDIGVNGEVLDVLNVQVLDSGGASVEPEMLDKLADQIFRNWSFDPAQDGNPPKPVRSDLFVQARITIQ